MHTFYKYLAILCLLALPLAVGGCSTCTDEMLDRLDEIEDALHDLEVQMAVRQAEIDWIRRSCGEWCDEEIEARMDELAALDSLYAALLEEMAKLRAKCPDWSPTNDGWYHQPPPPPPPQADGGEAATGDDGVTPIMDGDKAVGAGGEGGTVTLR